MEEPKRSKKAVIIGIVFLLLFATAYALVLCAFKSEGENRTAELSPNEKLGNDRIDASARIVTADPVKGDISVRLTFTPHGSSLRRWSNLEPRSGSRHQQRHRQTHLRIQEG